MIEAIPIFINSPFDDSELVDLDDEFTEDITRPESEGEENDVTEGIPDEEDILTGDDIKDVTGVDEIVPDPPEDDIPEDIDEAIDEHKEVTGTDGSDIKELDEETQKNILDDIKDAKETATETWTDLDGKVNDKLDSITELDISRITDSMKSIFGVICGNGISNPDFEKPVFDNVFKDLISKGLKDLLDCLLKEGIISGMEDHVEGLILDSIGDVIDTGSLDMMTWASDSVTGGLGSTFGEELISPISNKVKLPLDHKKSDNKDSLDKMTGLYDNLKPDWTTGFMQSTEDDVSPKYSLDPFSNPSEGSRELYMSDNDYCVSVIAGDALRENGDKSIKDTYPLSYFTP